MIKNLDEIMGDILFSPSNHSDRFYSNEDDDNECTYVMDNTGVLVEKKKRNNYHEYIDLDEREFDWELFDRHVNERKITETDDNYTASKYFIAVGCIVIAISLFGLSWYAGRWACMVVLILGFCLIYIGMIGFFRRSIFKSIIATLAMCCGLSILFSEMAGYNTYISDYKLHVENIDTGKHIKCFNIDSVYYFNAESLSNIGNFQITEVADSAETEYIRLYDENKTFHGPLTTYFGPKYKSISLNIQNQENGMEGTVNGYMYVNNQDDIVYVNLGDFIGSFGFTTENPDTDTLNIVEVSLF